MFVHETQFRVRYVETDQMGYVYYGNYAQYFEVGRVEAIRSLGLTYREMEEELGVMMPVKSLNIKYLRPVFYDELITVKTMITAMPERNINFHAEVYNSKGELTTGATITLAFVDIKLKQTVNIPEEFKKRLEVYFGG
ncbi:MAG: acyl-CoA thioesterase [Saprospiraceae bacterium]|jgi:acyl-CoA thioester hydrolase|nr:acyl-CoA thioesterase [Saprospiraceae bacterium]